MAPWGMPWQAVGGTMATPSVTDTALHGNRTECHGNPHSTSMSTAPRVRVRVRGRVRWYVVEVRGRFGGMPWKMPWKVFLPQVVPRHVTACRKNDNNVHPQKHFRFEGRFRMTKYTWRAAGGQQLAIFARTYARKPSNEMRLNASRTSKSRVSGCLGT